MENTNHDFSGIVRNKNFMPLAQIFYQLFCRPLDDKQFEINIYAFTVNASLLLRKQFSEAEFNACVKGLENIMKAEVNSKERTDAMEYLFNARFLNQQPLGEFSMN